MVAIDGPAASGKSTVARGVAARLEFVYVDSGAYYRGMTWQMLRLDLDPGRDDHVRTLLETEDWEFFVEHGAVRFQIGGEDPGEQLRSEPVRERVSDVAAVPEIRVRIVDWLRRTVEFGPVVMEGRDIGSVVFPDTKYKYYIDADPVERARRRHEEIARVESGQSIERVLDSLSRRDRKDQARATAPLQIPLGAKVIDSTHLSVDEVVDIIVTAVRTDVPAP